ncbi:MAG TPA: hypothetical protein VNW54_12200 [Granulicella sp.]|jgi:hypothetical protein|nr:hypothetical protein [Granulicella sp.]
MANKYGEAALIAARLEVPASVTAAERWDTAVRQLYPEKPYLQKKTAPRGAFLGLCEEGLVRGIPAGQYAPSNQNKTYALRAIALLQAGTHRTINALWTQVTEGGEIAHNAQMDVVLALWKNGLIVPRAS